jgi:hypothetical protein
MHMGDMTTRLESVKSRKLKGVNMGGVSADKSVDLVAIPVLFVNSYDPSLYQGTLILICFTGEKFATGQERFAPWYVYHKRIATHPVTNFSRPSVRLGTRPAAPACAKPELRFGEGRLHRLPDTRVSRCAARLTGRAPRRMKQVTINDPWY